MSAYLLYAADEVEVVGQPAASTPDVASSVLARIEGTRRDDICGVVRALKEPYLRELERVAVHMLLQQVQRQEEGEDLSDKIG